MNGWEATLAFGYFTDARNQRLEDPAVDLLAERIDAMEARDLLAAMRLLVPRINTLLQEDVRRQETPPLQQPPERILVTLKGQILLPDRYNVELRLSPLVKTVFLLFLHHPEGIRFGELATYRKELMHLYQKVSPLGDKERLEHSIDRLIDPQENAINEHVSRLSATLGRYFRPEQVPYYAVRGRAGSAKYIPAASLCVEWEDGFFSHP